MKQGRVTYRGVDGLVALEGAVLVETMVGFAKGDARAAPGDQALHSVNIHVNTRL
jgi:hypothetical protein